MQEYLEKLRKKPVHVRHTILVVTTTALTAVIFLVWLSFWANPSLVGGPGDTAAPSGTAPSSLLKDNWQSLIGTFQDGFSEIKNQFRF